MSRALKNFKDTQIFDWESEPHDERPSEFAQSTGYSVLSGYHVMPDRPMRPQGKGGINLVVVIGAIVLALGAAAMYGFVHLLRA